MRAVVLYGPNSLRYEDVPDPVLVPGDVLLRTKSAAVCGTDLRIVDGSKTRGVRFPSIIGHELAGEVVDLVPPVTGIRLGDRVSVAPIMACGRCYYCRHNLENLCADQDIIGYNHDGGFAEYVRLPARAVLAGNVFRLPDNVSYDEGALAEPLACCVNGNEKSQIRLGQSVLIIGAGPIGLMHVQLALVAGAREVIVSEPSSHRRHLARDLGATTLVDPAEEDLAAAVKERTEGVGVDSVIMAFGLPRLVGEALSLARKGGVVNLFAGFPGRGDTTIEANLIHYNETVVVGTSSSTLRHYKKALKLIAEGGVEVRRLVTSTFPLAATATAIETASRREGLRAMVHPDQ